MYKYYLPLEPEKQKIVMTSIIKSINENGTIENKKELIEAFKELLRVYSNAKKLDENRNVTTLTDKDRNELMAAISNWYSCAGFKGDLVPGAKPVDLFSSREDILESIEHIWRFYNGYELYSESLYYEYENNYEDDSSQLEDDKYSMTGFRKMVKQFPGIYEDGLYYADLMTLIWDKHGHDIARAMYHGLKSVSDRYYRSPDNDPNITEMCSEDYCNFENALGKKIDQQDFISNGMNKIQTGEYLKKRTYQMAKWVKHPKRTFKEIEEKYPKAPNNAKIDLTPYIQKLEYMNMNDKDKDMEEFKKRSSMCQMLRKDIDKYKIPDDIDEQNNKIGEIIPHYSKEDRERSFINHELHYIADWYNKLKNEPSGSEHEINSRVRDLYDLIGWGKLKEKLPKEECMKCAQKAWMYYACYSATRDEEIFADSMFKWEEEAKNNKKSIQREFNKYVFNKLNVDKYLNINLRDDLVHTKKTYYEGYVIEDSFDFKEDKKEDIKQNNQENNQEINQKIKTEDNKADNIKDNTSDNKANNIEDNKLDNNIEQEVIKDDKPDEKVDENIEVAYEENNILNNDSRQSIQRSGDLVGEYEAEADLNLSFDSFNKKFDENGVEREPQKQPTQPVLENVDDFMNKALDYFAVAADQRVTGGSKHPRQFEAIIRSAIGYNKATDDKRKEASLENLYKACRDYLDEHTDYGARQEEIKGQKSDGGRLRKQAVVYILSGFHRYANPELKNAIEKYEIRVKEEGRTFYHLDLDYLERSLEANVPKKKVADLKRRIVKDGQSLAYAELIAMHKSYVNDNKMDHIKGRQTEKIKEIDDQLARKNADTKKKTADRSVLKK